MGQYYKIVNVKKKQYLNPHKFGDGLKLMEFSMSRNGVLAGLAILLADGNAQGSGDLHSENPIVGSWAGDNIVVAGDYGESGKWVKDKDSNLYQVAELEGEDISLKVLEALFDDKFFLQDFEANNSFLSDEVKELISKKRKQNGLKDIKKWKVPSSKDVTVLYEVTDDNGLWSCECPAFKYGNGADCKHIKSIKTK